MTGLIVNVITMILIFLFFYPLWLVHLSSCIMHYTSNKRVEAAEDHVRSDASSRLTECLVSRVRFLSNARKTRSNVLPYAAKMLAHHCSDLHFQIN